VFKILLCLMKYGMNSNNPFVLYSTTPNNEFKFTRLNTPSSARATPIEMFAHTTTAPPTTNTRTNATKTNPQLTIRSLPLAYHSQDNNGSGGNTMNSPRRLSHSGALSARSYFAEDISIHKAMFDGKMSALTVRENNRGKMFLESIQQSHSEPNLRRTINNTGVSSRRPSSTGRVYKRHSIVDIHLDDQQLQQKQEQEFSESAVRECNALKKKLNQMLLQSSIDYDEKESAPLPVISNSDSNTRKKPRANSPNYLSGKYTKQLPKEVQKKILTIQKEAKEASKLNYSYPLLEPTPPKPLPNPIISRNKSTIMTPRMREEKQKQFALDKTVKIQQVLHTKASIDTEFEVLHRARIAEKYARPSESRESRIERYNSIYRQKQLIRMILLAKFVSTLSVTLVNHQVKNPELNRMVVPQDYDSVQSKTFMEHKQLVISRRKEGRVEEKNDTNVTHFMTKYVYPLYCTYTLILTIYYNVVYILLDSDGDLSGSKLQPKSLGIRYRIGLIWNLSSDVSRDSRSNFV
jgi:hypothetical protein